MIIETMLKRSAIVLVFALVTACSDSSTSGTSGPNLNTTHSYIWTNPSQHAAFDGRDGAGALVFNGKVWLLGGWREAGSPPSPNFPETGAPGCCTTSEVWSSSDGVNWTFVTVAAWERRHLAGWAVFNGKLWVVGGDSNSGHYQSDVWNSSDGEHWTQVTDSTPWSPRVLHYVLVFNNQLWVIGGQEVPEGLVPPPNPYPTEPVLYDDVWTSSDGMNWSKVGSIPHALGMICGEVVFDNQMWIIGGGTYGDAVQGFAGAAYNEVWSSYDGINWTVHTSAPWAARKWHNIAVFDNRMWVLAGGAGDGSGDRNDVWYSADGDHWTELPGTPWVERHAASVFVLNDALYVTGGADVTPVAHIMLNDVWELQIQSM